MYNYNYNNNRIQDLDYILKKVVKDDIIYYPYFFSFFQKYQKYSDYFVQTSIFDKEEYTKYKEDFLKKKNSNTFTDIEKSSIGSMQGMTIGDAMGARVEFMPLDYNYNKIKDMGDTIIGNFRLRPGQWTDDTSMGLCLSDSLIENKGNFDPRDIMMRFILWWFFGYNNAFRFDKKRPSKHSVGLGGNISGSLFKYIKDSGKNEYTKYGNRHTSGNGSIMRNAAIPLCYFRNEAKALDFAKKQSLITHQGDEAAGCCQLMTFIIIKILRLKNGNKLNKNNTKLKDILEDLTEFKCEYKSVLSLALSQKEGNDNNRNWNWKDKNFKYSEERAKKKPGYIGSYCMDGLAMALHVLYHTDSFQKAILKAVNLCGDADSVGSVVGQIAGAFYEYDSIPKDWIKKINHWDNDEIALRGFILCHLNEEEKVEQNIEIKEQIEQENKIIAETNPNNDNGIALKKAIKNIETNPYNKGRNIDINEDTTSIPKKENGQNTAKTKNNIWDNCCYSFQKPKENSQNTTKTKNNSGDYCCYCCQKNNRCYCQCICF